MEKVHEREVAINTIISNGVKNLDGMSIIGLNQQKKEEESHLF